MKYGAEATITRVILMDYAKLISHVTGDASIAGCGLEVYRESSVRYMFSEWNFLAVGLDELRLITNSINHRLNSTLDIDAAALAWRKRP